MFERFTQHVREVVARVSETLLRLVLEVTVPIAIVLVIEFHVRGLALRLRLSVKEEPRRYRPLRRDTMARPRTRGRKARSFKRFVKKYGTITVTIILPMIVSGLQIAALVLPLLL